MSVLDQFNTRVELSELRDLARFFQEHPDTDIDSEPESLSFASVAYLDRFKDKLIETGQFDDGELEAIMKHARGYAGGTASAEKRKEEDEPSLEGSEGYFQPDGFFDLQTYSASDMWLQITPKAGESFQHPRYGKIDFSHESSARMVDNFRKGVYQEHIPIDAEHETKLSGALGYYKELRSRDDGAIEARIDLTDRGRKALDSGQFRYFSPEMFRSWTDPSTGKKYGDVLVGGAFTTRPFFKDSHLSPLLQANEYSIWKATEGKVPMGRYQRDDKGDLVLDADGNPQLTEEATTADATALSEAAEGAVKKFRDDTGLTDEVIAKITEEDNEEEENEEMPKEFSEQFPDQFAEIQRLREVAEVAEQSRLQRKFSDVAMGRESAEAVPFVGEITKHVDHMVSLSEKFGEDSTELEWYVNREREHAVALAKSDTFSERGSSARGMGASLDNKVKAYRESNPEASEAEALDAVLSSDTSAYAEAREEERAAAAAL